MLSCMVKNEPFGYAHTFRKGLKVAKNKAAARIKVEDAHADLLLITTKDCGMWNTYDGCVEIMDTLRKHNYLYAHELIVYENAGEPFLVPYVISAGMNSMKLAPRLVLSMGGTLEGNVKALVGVWEKTVEFFGQTNKN